MLQKLFAYFILSIMLVGLCMPAYAVNKDDEDYYNEEEGSIVSYLINHSSYKVDIFNTPNISESKFVIRFSSAVNVSGCARTTDSKVEIKRVLDKIRIKVRDSEIYLNDTMPRYSHNDCKISQNRIFFDVPLDRDDLIKHKVKGIRVSSKKYGEFSVLDIKVSKQKILYKTSKEGKTKKFWFFPKNTIMLQAPKAKPSNNVVDLITSLGVSKNLVPLEKTLTKYHLPYRTYDYQLFTDPTGKILKQLKSSDDRVAIGTISPTRTIYDTNGKHEESYDIQVYAKTSEQKQQDN